MVSPGAPRLTQVHTKHRRRAAAQRGVHTAIVFRRQHANPISGNAQASPSPLTEEARGRRARPGPARPGAATWTCRLVLRSGANAESSLV